MAFATDPQRTSTTVMMKANHLTSPAEKCDSLLCLARPLTTAGRSGNLPNPLGSYLVASMAVTAPIARLQIVAEFDERFRGQRYWISRKRGLPVRASPSEVSALASGIVMPVQGNRSHASSKLQVTICFRLHPKKSTGIMYVSMASLSGKLHQALGPLLAGCCLSG